MHALTENYNLNIKHDDDDDIVQNQVNILKKINHGM